jgi:hypothetical protein
MTDDNFVQARIRGAGILAGHVVGGRMGNELVTFLDEEGKVTELAVFHDKINVCSGFEAIMKGNDVRMPKGLEDLDFAI